MESDALIEIDEDQIRVTEAGRPFLRNLCMVFDAYLIDAGGPTSPTGFSATV
jgi:oxygen-independent coproporphyrinogen-3 oxidase